MQISPSNSPPDAETVLGVLRHANRPLTPGQIAKQLTAQTGQAVFPAHVRALLYKDPKCCGVVSHDSLFRWALGKEARSTAANPQPTTPQSHTSVPEPVTKKHCVPSTIILDATAIICILRDANRPLTTGQIAKQLKAQTGYIVFPAEVRALLYKDPTCRRVVAHDSSFRWSLVRQTRSTVADDPATPAPHLSVPEPIAEERYVLLRSEFRFVSNQIPFHSLGFSRRFGRTLQVEELKHKRNQRLIRLANIVFAYDEKSGQLRTLFKDLDEFVDDHGRLQRCRVVVVPFSGSERVRKKIRRLVRSIKAAF